ncbi:hypothetical protein FO519_003348 [Halicephalobus sp. NKZ332]|nr:hypothetical protein FO519_003348 [Halicephalobus sp. NKZ332]
MFLPILTLALAATCPPEGVTVTKNCFTDYFQAFNFTLFPDFATFSELISRQINDGGVPALESQCKTLNTLKSCLGSYEAACVNGTVIASNFGVNQNDAFAYAGDYAEQAYYCNDGFDLMKQNFDCMVKMENSPDANNCVNIAVGDFQSGKICKGYNDMVYCMSDVYTKTCGPGISPLICNMLQKDLQAQSGTGGCQWFDCSKPFPFNATTF